MRKFTLSLLLFASQFYGQITGLQFDTTNQSIWGFATQVSISGNEVLANGYEMLAIAPPYESRAFLFEYDGSALNQTQGFLPADIAIGDDFGKALDIEGEWLAIGAPGQNESGISDKGSVYVYHKVGGAWSFAQKITDATGVQDDKFGSYVSISGDFLFVSSLKSPVGDAHNGNIHVYKRNGDNWDYVQSIYDASSYNFGQKTILKDGHLITSSQNQVLNQVRYYSYTAVNDTWTLEGSSDFTPYEYSRSDFAYDNGKLYALQPGNSINGNVATLVLSGTTWTAQSIYEIPMDFANDFVFGHILVENSTMILGATSYILQMQRKFIAHVLHDNSGQWEHVNSLMGAGNPAQDDYFGNALALDGNHLVVGANNEGYALPMGKGYFFDLQLSTPDRQISNFIAYPNPASDNLFLDAGNAEIAKAELFSIAGALLKSSTDQRQLDVSDLQAGIYVLKVRLADGSSASQKIVKR